MAEEYKQLGYDVKIKTEDGSAGKKGLATDLLKDYFNSRKNDKIKFYACGPNPMMIAIAKMAEKHGKIAELSLDHAMCCGVGACYACVIKVKDPDNPASWKYMRTCREGPVFPSNTIFIEHSKSATRNPQSEVDMADLNTKLGSLVLKNPVMTASGTFGYGYEYSDFYPLDKLGAVVVKGISPCPVDGNPMPRHHELKCGLLNAIGLQNPE